jgi:hypothetical protein
VSKLKGFKTIKRFVLRYWLEGKHKKITLGIFKPGFGIKEINDKLYQIVKEHTNEKERGANGGTGRRAGLKIPGIHK